MRAWKVALLAVAACAIVVASNLVMQWSRGEGIASPSSGAAVEPSAGTTDETPVAHGSAASDAERDGADLQPTIAGAERDDVLGDLDLARCDPLVIHGRVTSAASGEPIAGAEVAADRAFQDAVRADERGDWSLTMPSLPWGELKVEARAPGFGRREARFVEFLGDDLEVDLELMPARGAAGRLTGPDGAPVAGADVSAHASIQGSEGDMIDLVATRSDADGSFLLADLRPDLPHVLRVSKTGLATVVYAFPQDEKTMERVEFGEISLQVGRSIEVRVVDDAGAPIPETKLSLIGGNPDWLRFTTSSPLYNRRDLWRRPGTTDASGRCRFDQLLVGTWTVDSYKPGRPKLPDVEVTVAEGDAVVPVTLTLPRGLSITGRVVDEAGRRKSGANVYLVGADGYLIWTKTDELGSFAVCGLQPGDWRVTIDAPWFADPSDPASSSGVVVAAGSVDVVVVSRPAPTDVIRGIVRDSKRTPVALASVKAFLVNGRETGVAVQSRVGGRFALRVPKGARVQLIAGPGEAWPPSSDDGKYDLSGFPAVTADASSGEVELLWFDPGEGR